MKKLFLFLFLLLLFASSAFATSYSYPTEFSSVNLVAVNVGGYETTLVLVNHTLVPRSAKVWGPQFQAITLEPFKSERIEHWGPEINIESLSVQGGLTVYVEIKDPNGIRIRINPLTEKYQLYCENNSCASVLYDSLTAYFYDLLSDETYKSYLFVKPGDLVDVKTSFGVTVGNGKLERVIVPDGITSFTLTAKSWLNKPIKYFAFVIVSKQPNGEAFAILPLGGF